jgi:hypothetical protein
VQFGGLFQPAPSLPKGWQWANLIDPVRYAFSATVSTQFYCAGGAAAGCPQIPALIGGNVTYVDRSDYVQVRVCTDDCAKTFRSHVLLPYLRACTAYTTMTGGAT